MALTLPTQVQKESNLKGYAPRVGVEIAGFTTPEYVSTHKTFSSDAHTYTGKIPENNPMNVGLSTERLGGYGKIGGFNLSIQNQELYSNMFVAGTDPEVENLAVIIKLFFDDGSAILDAESLQLFEGVIEDVDEIDYEKVTFQIEPHDLIKNKKIGTLVERANDATGYSAFPEESIGKMKPIIYGDHKYYYGNTSDVTNTTADQEHNMVPAIYLGTDQAGDDRWLIADHICESVDKIWVWDTGLERMVEVVTFVVEQNTASGCIISIAKTDSNTSTPYYDYRYGAKDSANAVNNNTSWTNAERGVDADVDTRTECAIAALDPAGSDADVDLVFDAYEGIPDGDISAVDVFVKSDFHMGTDVAEGNLVYTCNGVDLLGLTNEDTIAVSAVGADVATTAGVNLDVPLHFERTSAAAVNRETHAHIYEVWKRVTYTRELEDYPRFQVYFAGDGMEYGTWIDDRAVAEGYSETHADDDNSGSLIENFAGVIESLYKDWIGLAAADTELHEDSFNVASNDLSTTKASFAILEKEDGLDLIDEILQKIGAVCFPDYDNKEKMRVFVSGDNFTVSGDSVPNNKDIFEFDPQSTFKIVAGENDALDIKEGGGAEQQLTLTASEYTTGALLAAQVQTQLRAASGSNNHNFTYSAATGKFSVQAVGAAIEFLWVTGTNVATSCGRFLGADISADDTQGINGASAFAYSLWADSFVEHPVVEDTFRIRKTEEDIITSTDVLWNYNYYTKRFQGAPQSATDATYHAETIFEEFEHPYTKDLTTTQFYRNFLVKNDGSGRISKKYYELTFRSFLNGVCFEPWDIVNVRHPILAGMFGDEGTKKWLILDINPIDLENMEMEFRVVEMVTST